MFPSEICPAFSRKKEPTSAPGTGPVSQRGSSSEFRLGEEATSRMTSSAEHAKRSGTSTLSPHPDAPPRSDPAIKIVQGPDGPLRRNWKASGKIIGDSGPTVK